MYMVPSSKVYLKVANIISQCVCVCYIMKWCTLKTCKKLKQQNKENEALEYIVDSIQLYIV